MSSVTQDDHCKAAVLFIQGFANGECKLDHNYQEINTVRTMAAAASFNFRSSLCPSCKRQRPKLDTIPYQLLLQMRNSFPTSLFNTHTAVLTFFSTETGSHWTLLVQ